MLPKRLVYSTNDANSVRHANALITFKLRFSWHELASSGRSPFDSAQGGLTICLRLGNHSARRKDRRYAVALSNGWERTGGGHPVARFRRDFADVATDHSIARTKVYRDRAGFARHLRFVDFGQDRHAHRGPADS